MQLIRLNPLPSGRRGTGLFVVLFDEHDDRAEARSPVSAASELHDELGQPDARLAHAAN